MRKIILIAVFVCCPLLTYGQVINEIMYDVSGTDTKREWIEIYNSSAASINVTTLRLKENDVNHTIAALGSPDLPAGGYAVIADNTDQFKVDNPEYTGLLFDSAFSLNNEGEAIALTKDGVVLNSASYTSALGAAGDGNSLQLHDGIFISATPTPGAVNATQATTPAEEKPAETTNTESAALDISSHNSQVKLTDEEEETTIKIGAGRERVTLERVPLSFSAVAKALKDQTKPVFTWVFGDGFMKKGRIVEHAYKYEGTYNVVLHARMNGSYAVSRTTVTVRTPHISLEVASGTPSVLVRNEGKSEVNLGGFILKNGAGEFEFPKDTIISSDTVLQFDVDILGFELISGALALKGPGGTIFAETVVP